MNPLYCCNGCGHVPGFGDNRPYFMSSCGHVICSNCRQLAGSTCPACHTDCRYADITNDPKPEIKVYFSDPLDVMKEGISRAAKITQFQNGQAQRYKAQMSKLLEQHSEIQRERDALYDENTSLKRKLEDSLEQRDQTWIGNGVMAGSRVDSGFFTGPIGTPEPMPFVSQQVQPLGFDPPQRPPAEPSPFFGTTRTSSQVPPSAPVFGCRSSNVGGGGAGVSYEERNQNQTRPYYATTRFTRQHTPTLNEIQLQRRQTSMINLNAAPNRSYGRSAVQSVSSVGSGRSSAYLTSSSRPPSTIAPSVSTSYSNISSRSSALLNRLQHLTCSNRTRSTTRR